ncbi:MAG TPA: ribosome biogenesis GTP-binding protein YihA/YsxC [Gemmatimonadales bacterium]|nr:ribosome biogenesis GTP-binding protein YihA/YsxC [Gemmatimonadales bacterium]
MEPSFRRSPPPPSPLSARAVEFVGSFPTGSVALEPPHPEIAFIGRSNVGKSSLLNALVGRPGLARVSATPGKTQLLNVFRLPELYLVDLPGYGFARTSKTARAAFRRLIGEALARPRLVGVVWLLDIRHDPSADDREMHRRLAERGVPVLAALTKADKLGRQQQLRRRAAIRAALGLQDDQVQVTSSATGLGIADLAESVLAAIQPRETP